MTVEERPQRPGRTGGASDAVRMGWWVFVGLAVLTVVEYVIAVTVDLNLPVMAVIAVVKAGLIVWYFMHLLRLWRAGEGGH